MSRWIVALGAVVLFLGCQSKSPTRTGALPTTTRGPASLGDVLTRIPQFSATVTAEGALTASNCVSVLDGISGYLYDQPSEFFIPGTDEERALVRTQGPALAEHLQRLRWTVREKFVTFTSPSADCVASVRRLLRVSRVAEETLALWMKQQGLITGPDRLFAGGPMRDLRNPAVSDHQIRAGDVILMRGSSFVSAMIARIGNEDAHFSHLAIVGEDSRGRLFLVESLIESGVGIIPFEKWLAEHDNLSRAVVFRHKDTALGRRAGRAIFDEASRRLRLDREIPYDFTMNSTDHSAIFCSEVVYWAFELVGAPGLPAHPSGLGNLRGKRLLVDMGIDRASTFAPSDLEIDPSFEFVREHRSLDVSRQVQQQDAVASSIFHWKVALGYDLQDTWMARQFGRILTGLRQAGLLTSYMQKHMSRQMLANLIRYRAVAEHLEDVIERQDRRFERQFGRPMAYKDMLTVLEKERQIDCRLHTEIWAASVSRFHDYLRPNNARDCSREAGLPPL